MIGVVKASAIDAAAALPCADLDLGDQKEFSAVLTSLLAQYGMSLPDEDHITQNGTMCETSNIAVKPASMPPYQDTQSGTSMQSEYPHQSSGPPFYSSQFEQPTYGYYNNYQPQPVVQQMQCPYYAQTSYSETVSNTCQPLPSPIYASRNYQHQSVDWSRTTNFNFNWDHML